MGHWVVDAYGAVWFYTMNPEFFSHNQYFPGTRTQSENPAAVFEGHLSYDFKPRLWSRWMEISGTEVRPA